MRATSAAAAAPNSNTIGGAGTGAGGPPLDLVLPPELALLALDPLPVEEDTSPLDPPVDEALETVAPPVLVEDPPLLVEDPPVEVDPPLDVDDITMLPLDPLMWIRKRHP
ncbi:hypothetical protein [Sphingomonas sp. ZB1N12]|uniref:hypothetical protein n=1 Tax=Sphingomonas arabinosi TaxID=3096160 RepID=UPI002FC8E90A